MGSKHSAIAGLAGLLAVGPAGACTTRPYCEVYACASETGTGSTGAEDTSVDSTGGPVCGNGVVDEGEDCDGDDLGGATCATMEGFDGGTLGCTDDCTFDTSACMSCGNEIVEGDEECDGTDFGGVNCQDLGFGVGLPMCTSDCTFDTSNCPDEGKHCMSDVNCASGLVCVFGSCYDGSAGDPCQNNDDCSVDAPFCVEYFCSP